ncbi:MAG: nitronate monooxygenase, partial [Gemmatimonadales bacterium]|nr:nitronate monooxygenase [Gemmatimonadales bacterium]
MQEGTPTTRLPPIIQGGMGVGISDWRLARSVAMQGQLGVVSGTAIDTVLVRRLQDGDAGGQMRRAMAAFPVPGVAEDLLRRYFLPGGRPPGAPYKLLSVCRKGMSARREQVIMLAAFVEVFLAREGHDGLVGMNL